MLKKSKPGRALPARVGGRVDRRSSAKEEGSALPVRVGGVSMRVVSESSRACRDSTTVRGVRALGERVQGCDLSY